MVEAKTTFRGLPVVAAAAGALLSLAGCAGTNVGSEWQSPMAQGKACVSIASADPAIAKPGAGTMTIRKPLHENRAAAAPGAAQSTATAGAAKDGKDCRGICNPFSWLAGLFGAREAVAEDGLSGCGSGRDRAGGRTRHRSGGAARRTRPWRRRSADRRGRRTHMDREAA